MTSFSGPFTNLLLVGVGAGRKILERRQDTLQIQIHILVRILAQFLQRYSKQKMVGARVERKDPIEISQAKGPFLKPEMKFAPLKNSAVLVAENRKQHLVSKSLPFRGSQSMSKNCANLELGPFSKTSIHHSFCGSIMPMWLRKQNRQFDPYWLRSKPQPWRQNLPGCRSADSIRYDC